MAINKTFNSWSVIIQIMVRRAVGAGRVRATLSKPVWSALVALLVLGGAVPMPETAADSYQPDGSPPGSAPSAAPYASSNGTSEVIPIGHYTRSGERYPLFSWHVREVANGMRIQAPSGARDLEVNANYLEASMGAWGSNTPFWLSQNGTVTFEKPVAHVVPLRPGAEKAFTMGHRDTILFAERPMWVNVSVDGANVTLDLDDGNATGQPVFVSKKLLHEYGIHRPLAFHEDGQALNVTRADDGSGFWIDVPHFSEIILTSAHIRVYGRTGTVTTYHTGEVTWDSESQELEIYVPFKLTTYKVLVERDWFDQNLSGHGLTDRQYTIEQYQGAPYYMVTLASSQTPTTLVFRNLSALDKTLFTREGSPTVVVPNAFNGLQTVRGPMWFRAEYDGNGIDVELIAIGGGAYDVLITEAWTESLLSGRPIFSTASGPLYPDWVPGHGWVVTFTNSLALRIWDSGVGPLLPPHYEIGAQETLLREGGCGIRHVVMINASAIEYEGPGCVNSENLTGTLLASDVSAWMHGAVVYTTCALLMINASGTHHAYAAPCSDASPSLGSIPPFVSGYCETMNWTQTSEEAFCGGILSRHEAAGAPVDGNGTAAQSVGSVLRLNAPMVDRLDEIRQDSVLQTERAWAESLRQFLRGVRLEGPCVNATQLLAVGFGLPEVACGRAFNEFIAGNETHALNQSSLATQWKALFSDHPCMEGLAPLAILDGRPTVVCGNRLPLIRGTMENFTSSDNWTAQCPAGPPIGVVSPAGNHTGACATAVNVSASALQAWANLTAWPACGGAPLFVLDPAGPSPSTLCGKPATSLADDFSVVFNEVTAANPCGTKAPALLGGPGLSDPAVLCGNMSAPPAGYNIGSVCTYTPIIPWPRTTFESGTSLDKLCGVDRDDAASEFWEGLHVYSDTIGEIDPNECPIPNPFILLMENGPMVVCPGLIPDPDDLPDPEHSYAVPVPCGDEGVPFQLGNPPLVPDKVCGIPIPPAIVEDLLEEIESLIPCDETIWGGIGEPSEAAYNDCTGQLVSISPAGDLGQTLERAKNQVLGALSEVYEDVCGPGEDLYWIADHREVFCGNVVGNTYESIEGNLPCDVEELLAPNPCGLVSPPDMCPVDELPEFGPMCLTYRLFPNPEHNGSLNQTVQAGLPAYFESGEVAWLAGAPLLLPEIGTEVRLVPSGFAGTFAVAVTDPAISYCPTCKVTVSVGEMTLALTMPESVEGQAPGGLWIWAISGIIAVEPPIQDSDGLPPGTPTELITADLVFWSSDGHGGATFGVEVGDFALNVIDTVIPGIVNSPANPGWVAQILYDGNALVQDPSSTDMTRGKRVNLAWEAPTDVHEIGVDVGGQSGRGAVTVGRMPHLFTAEASLVVTGFVEGANVGWDALNAPASIAVAVDSVGVRLSGIPPKMNLTAYKKSFTGPTDTEWTRAYARLFGVDDSGVLSGMAALVHQGLVPSPIDLNVSLSKAFIDAFSISTTTELTYEAEADERDSVVIPYLRLVVREWDNPEADRPVLGSVIIKGKEQGVETFRVELGQIQLVRLDTTEAGNDGENGFVIPGISTTQTFGYEVKLGPDAPAVVMFREDSTDETSGTHTLAFEGRCSWLAGNMLLNKATDTVAEGDIGPGEWKRAYKNRTWGSGDFVVESSTACSGQTLDFRYLLDRDGVETKHVAAQLASVTGWSDFSLELDVTAHGYEKHHEVCTQYAQNQGSLCVAWAWVKTSSKGFEAEADLNAALNDGSVWMQLGPLINEKKEGNYPVDVQLGATRLKDSSGSALSVSYRGKHGFDYENHDLDGWVPDDHWIDLGWSLLPAGRLDFDVWVDAYSGGGASHLDIDVDPIGPSFTMDQVTLQRTGVFLILCGPQDFPLTRLGDVEGRCDDDKLIVRTPAWYGV